MTKQKIRGVEKAEYPLSVVINPGEEINITLHYQTNHFDKKILTTFAENFKEVIKNIIESPYRFTKDTTILTKEESENIIEGSRSPETVYIRNKGIHELFEEQVEKAPGAIAVELEDERINYKELNERSNRLASYLRKQGVGPEVLVGIGLERSIEMVVGILGILKAGGGYVPLELGYPEERLDYMLTDSGAEVS